MPKGHEIVCSDLNKGDPDSIHFAYLHPDDGRALRYHFDEFMVDWIPRLSSQLVEGVDLAAWKDYFSDDLLSLFIEQALYLELFQSARDLFRRDFAARMGWNWNKPVLILPELAELVRKNWPGPVAQTISGSRLLAGKRALSRLRRGLLPYRQAVWCRDGHREKWHRPMIGVELVEGIDPAGKNDAFWMGDGAVAPDRVVFIVERHNAALNNLRKSIEYADRVGASVVTTDAELACKINIPYWKSPPESELRQYPVRPELTGKGADSKARRWLFRNLQVGGARVEYWKRFFLRHNISVYQHFTEMSVEAVLRRVAGRYTNMIEIGRMRSQFFEKHSAAFYFQHQIAMVWNRDVVETLAASKTKTEYAVEIGYPSYSGQVSRNARPRQFDPAVSLTCVVFDNHSHHNNHFTRQDLEAFYTAIISVADKFTELGLLVKSKKPMILNALPAVKSRLEQLETQGRCIIVSGQSASAAANAIHADIAIGIPGSTAVCEAALLGCKALMFDPSGAGRFSETTASGVVFRDLNEFKASLEKTVLNPADTPAQESFRRQLTSVPVGEAHRRAAKFINAYLDAREDGHAGQASLNSAIQACQKYVVKM